MFKNLDPSPLLSSIAWKSQCSTLWFQSYLLGLALQRQDVDHCCRGWWLAGVYVFYLLYLEYGCVCMYVYVYVYIYIYIHTYICLCGYTHLYTHIYMYIYLKYFIIKGWGSKISTAPMSSNAVFQGLAPLFSHFLCPECSPLHHCLSEPHWTFKESSKDPSFMKPTLLPVPGYNLPFYYVSMVSTVIIGLLFSCVHLSHGFN